MKREKAKKISTKNTRRENLETDLDPSLAPDQRVKSQNIKSTRSTIRKSPRSIRIKTRTKRRVMMNIMERWKEL